MASEPKVSVSVEALVMKGLKELAINIRDEYGVAISSVHFDWTDVSATNGRNSIVNNISVTLKEG